MLIFGQGNRVKRRREPIQFPHHQSLVGEPGVLVGEPRRFELEALHAKGRGHAPRRAFKLRRADKEGHLAL